MFKQSRLAISVIYLLWGFGAPHTLAQTPADRQAQAPLVTAATTSESVRFTAPARVYEMRLEVFAADGQPLYDSDFKFGNLLDWGLHDQQRQRIADGSYRCVVTIRALNGSLTRKQGTLLLQEGRPTLQTAQVPESIRPTNPLAAFDVAEFLALPGKGTAMPLTALAHDGQQGRLVSGLGGLSFRLGDFFMGKDVEHMRLTTEGKLGIGVENPQAKLDVAGLIRTSEGIVFPDGSVQTTAYVASGRSIGERTGIQRDAQGRAITEQDGKGIVTEDGKRLAPNAPSATVNSLAKFTTTGGALGDSTITEVGGNVGIGTTTPITGLDYKHTLAPFLTRDIGTTNFGIPQSAIQIGVTNTASRNINVGPSFLFFADDSAGNKEFLGRLSAAWENPTDGAEAGSIRFQVRANSADIGASTERMRIAASGNVGIGTSSPSYKLHVVGGSGYAVYGETTNGKGIAGVATDTNGQAVYGLASTSGAVAGYFSGDVSVTGTLMKGGGSFKIDHPLDPANKYLSHSFVESPDMMNIYNGNVTTNSEGVAIVTLPAYFEALNRDFRYQLTVIGAFAQAIVAEKIKGNQFKIATSLPNVEVSWQVTGVRQDAWANRHRIPNEEFKSEAERGHFLHPDLYGQSEEKGMDWARDPQGMRKLKERARENAKPSANETAKPVKQ